MKYTCPTNPFLTYNRVREGPNHAIVLYKNCSRVILSAKELRQVYGPAKFTPSVQAESQWLEEMIEKYGDSRLEVDQERVLKEGFGPEAHTSGGVEPQENTRMIV